MAAGNPGLQAADDKQGQATEKKEKRAVDSEMPYIVFRDYPNKKYKCSMRLLRICEDNHIHRLSDFSSLTFEDVLSLPECGEATAMHIKKILRDNGLDFGEHSDQSGTAIPTLRNSMILELVAHGESYRAVARRFAISHSRVAQIYKELS